MKIKVTRPFYFQSEPQGLGMEIDVDDRFGREMIHNGKAEQVFADEPPADEPPAKKGKK